MHDEIRGMTEVNKAVKALRSKIFAWEIATV